MWGWVGTRKGGGSVKDGEGGCVCEVQQEGGQVGVGGRVGRAGQGRAGQGRAGQGRAGQGRQAGRQTIGLFYSRGK